MRHVLPAVLLLAVLPTHHASARALPTVVCSGNQLFECAPANGVRGVVQAMVHDIDGSPLTIRWLVNGQAVATNNLPPFLTTNVTLLTLSNNFAPGTNEVLVSVSEGGTNMVTCSSTVIVRATVPPRLLSLTATPRVLWPPNHRMVPISIGIQTDACGPVTWQITSIQSSEAVDARGSGHTSPDWIIAGPRRALVRAERSGRGPGRVYTLGVEVSDGAGNSTNGTVQVLVPHDRGR